MATAQEAIGKKFLKGTLNNLMLPQVFGSNGFHSYSVFKDSGVVLHEIVRPNYVKLLPIYQSSRIV